MSNTLVDTMRLYHKKILDLLHKKGSLSSLELSLLTGYTYGGLTSRISELRKLGYNIQLQEIQTKKYVLVSIPQCCFKKKDGEEPIEQKKEKIHEQNIEKREKDEKDKIADQIVEWVQERNKFNSKIDLNQLSNELKLSLEMVKDGVGRLFQRCKILQISPLVIVIYP